MAVRNIFPDNFNKAAHDNIMRVVVYNISGSSTVPVPTRMIIIKGVKGGIYELIIVNDDPGFVIK